MKRKIISKVLSIGLVFLVIGVMSGGSLNPVDAAATTIYVPDNYPTIQAAVDAASPGDTIIVRDGTYTENIDVNTDNLTIQSENGAESTIVQADNSSDHVFEVSADYVNIRGFTVTSANGSDKAGIYLSSGIEYATIANNTALNNYYGIYLGYHTSNNILINNTSSNNSNHGIYLGSHSSNNILINNTSSNNSNDGIHLLVSNDNQLTSNVASNNTHGIYLFGSDNNELTGNVASNNNYYGIYLDASNNNQLTGNVASNNTYGGIKLSSSWYNELTNNTANSNHNNGIWLYKSIRNVLMKNIVRLNDNRGIELSPHSGNNILARNIVSLNSRGISLYESSNNIAYLNNFVDNLVGVAWSNQTNTWNSPEELTYNYNGNTYTNYLGNYWSDYTGSDADGNGIGDSPYSINSDNDSYPLMEPFESYSVDITVSFYPITIYVPDDSPTIGSAIGQATAGDIIIVRDGTYKTNLYVNKRLTIRSENGPANCIVEAYDRYKPVFDVGSDYVTISGFTIKGADKATYIDNVPFKVGSGVKIFNYDYSNISNNIISNNWFGIYLETLADNNVITNNTIADSGKHGIYIHQSDRTTITNNTLTSASIYLHYSNWNHIYLNNMPGSYSVFSQGGLGNIWNSPAEITYSYNGTTYRNYLGNHWSDYSGTDGNNDGIGDTPYNINFDNDSYPLVQPFENYVLAGDANGDGMVNAIDITKVERIIVGLDAPTPGSDANQDGNIDALDITKVERIIAGLE